MRIFNRPSTVFVLAVLFSATCLITTARAERLLQSHFRDAAQAARSTQSPIQKRDILATAFSSATSVLSNVQAMPLTTAADRASLEIMKQGINEKQQELQGTGGFTRVSDSQLDGFALYTVQDLEQAGETITISVVTLLLILIVVILVAR